MWYRELSECQVPRNKQKPKITLKVTTISRLAYECTNIIWVDKTVIIIIIKSPEQRWLVATISTCEMNDHDPWWVSINVEGRKWDCRQSAESMFDVGDQVGVLQPLGACLSARRATAQASAPWAGVWLSYRGTCPKLALTMMFPILVLLTRLCSLFLCHDVCRWKKPPTRDVQGMLPVLM